MPFRLFGETKLFKTRKQAQEAALTKGDPGYLWVGTNNKHAYFKFTNEYSKDKKCLTE